MRPSPRTFSLALAAALAAPGAFSADGQDAGLVRVQAPVVALRHVKLVDGTGGTPKDNQTIVIEKGRITKISSEDPPEGATVLDLPGYSVLPGLVGMHDHMYYPAPGGMPLYPEHGSSFPVLYLAGGVTSLRTTGSVETYTDLAIKNRIDAGTLVGPKIHVTGPYFEGPGSYTVQMHELKDAEDARRTANYWLDEGVTSFKAYMHITSAELTAIIQAAHARHVKVTGHLCSIGFREAAALGIDDLEHGLVVDTEFYSKKKPGECPQKTGDVTQEMAEKLNVQDAPVQEMIRDLVAHHVAVTSTLPVFETIVPNRPPIRDAVIAAMTPAAQASYLEIRARIADGAAKSAWPALLKKEMEFEREFVKAGGLLLAGLDPTGYGGVVAGFGDQREVELLVEAGFTPLEAIRIATLNGAQFLGEEQSIGSVAVGKAADLMVVKGDPATTIADIEKVEIVFKDGVGYDSAKLVASVKGTVGLE
jgi:imidazolonepropionase-like amidohydrolase